MNDRLASRRTGLRQGLGACLGIGGDVVRLGRVQRIERERIVLEHGSVPADPEWLYVHCWAGPFRSAGPEPIFQPGRIAPQRVRNCQPMFSAALVAFIETLDIDDAGKNPLCQVVPLPERPIDWLRLQAVVTMNQHQWLRVDAIRQWLESARLDGFAGRLRVAGKTAPDIQALGLRFKAAAFPAAAQRQALLAGANERRR